ncbi:MAG: hypothetical protein SFV54_16610 [Bryobacteraceae bacterium]|nr:hypothetical protein [Bryobacteraceae bacterium]
MTRFPEPNTRRDRITLTAMLGPRFLLLSLSALTLAAQEVKFDPRLSVHTIVREDLFAGYMVNDMERFDRGERTLEALLAERPEGKAALLAWKGANELYRAVRAHEAKNEAEFSTRYASALEAYGEAERSGARDFGVAAVSGASLLLFADRLPRAEQRSQAYEKAWTFYQAMWKQQGGIVEKLPLHIKGELLSGLAMSAQRTARAAESAAYLDKMLTVLAGTPYEARAKRWKEEPAVAGRTTLICQTCHDAGRLEATKARLAAAR